MGMAEMVRLYPERWSDKFAESTATVGRTRMTMGDELCSLQVLDCSCKCSLMLVCTLGKMHIPSFKARRMEDIMSDFERCESYSTDGAGI